MNHYGNSRKVNGEESAYCPMARRKSKETLINELVNAPNTLSGMFYSDIGINTLLMPP